MLINELLPNPTGKDTSGEFIELWNNGDKSANLSGYILQDKGGKQYVLRGELKAKEFLTLPYALTKLNLNNTGDAVYLFDSAGQLADKADYKLQPKEGVSFARRDDGTFAFTDTSTPGAQNIFKEVYVQKENFNFESAGATVLNSLPGLEAGTLIIFSSIVLSALFIYFLKDAISPKEYILE